MARTAALAPIEGDIETQTDMPPTATEAPRRKRKSAPRQPARLFIRAQVVDENKQSVTYTPGSSLDVVEVARIDGAFAVKYFQEHVGKPPEGLFAIVEVPRTVKEDGSDDDDENGDAE